MNLQKLHNRIVTGTFGTLFLLLPLVFTSVNEELFEFNKMLVVYAVALVLVCCWISKIILTKTFSWKRSALDIPLVLFVISQFLSTIFSMHPRTSLFGYYTRFNGGFFSVMAYTSIYWMWIQLTKPKDVGKYIRMLLIGGVIAALFAFPEHFGHSISCLMFTSHSDPVKGFVIGNFDVSCWVQDVQSRIFGSFGQPNWLAAYMIMLMPIALTQLFVRIKARSILEDTHQQELRGKLTTLATLALFAAVLIFTQSRSGVAALFGEIGMGIALLGASFVVLKQKKQSTRPIGTMITACVGSFALVVLIAFVSNSPLTARFTNMLARFEKKPAASQTSSAAAPAGTQLEVGGSESGAIRSIVWNGALKVFLRYPILGSGVETFAYSYYRDRPAAHNLVSEWDFLYNKAHNEFLNYLATTGIVGLSAYMALLIAATLIPLIGAWKLLQQDTKTPNRWYHILVLGALSIGVVGISISNFFGFSTVVVSLLLFLFPAFAHSVMHLADPEHDDAAMNGSMDQWVAIGVVVLITLLPLFFIWKLWHADTRYKYGKDAMAQNNIQVAFPSLQEAVTALPGEPTYHDELSSVAATAAVALARTGDATGSGYMKNLALQESQLTLEQNPVHILFYKTRLKVLLTLAAMDPSLYTTAETLLSKVHELSPTDPRLIYYQGLLAQQRGDNATFEAKLLEAIKLKANDELVRNSLAQYYEQTKQPAKALEQYQYMVQFINPNNMIAQDKIASLSAKKK